MQLGLTNAFFPLDCCKSLSQCPWIWTCVGHRNLRYFVLFLLYLWLGCTFVLCCAFPHLICLVTGNPPYSGTIDSAGNPVPLLVSSSNFLIGAVICMAGFVACLGFLSFTFYLLATNQTTLEFYSGAFTKLPDGNPYDLGVWANLVEVFGQPTWQALGLNAKTIAALNLNGVTPGRFITVLAWTLPCGPNSAVSSARGDGLIYPMNNGIGRPLPELMPV